MVLIVLLLVATAGVIIGLAYSSVGWFIVSLVASVLALAVLYRSWGTIKERRAHMARGNKADRADKGDGKGDGKGDKRRWPDEGTPPQGCGRVGARLDQ